MSVQPTDWSVVILGRWNRAIFTPDWIARHIFQTESSEAIQVEVALDEFVPHRVTYNETTVIVPPGRLVIAPKTCTLDRLNYARSLAVQALNKLPETPLAAAGWNVKYEVDDLSQDAFNLLMPPIDVELSDAQFELTNRTIRRTITFGNGVLNLTLTAGTDQATQVEFNFHRSATAKDQLTEWLLQPMNDANGTLQKIMAILNLTMRVERDG